MIRFIRLYDDIRMLKSDYRYDDTDSTQDATHIHFHFSEYEQEVFVPFSTGNEWSFVIPVDELLKILCDWREKQNETV